MRRIDLAFMMLLIAAMALVLSGAAAETALLPEVVFEMTLPEYWTEKDGQPDAVLAQGPEIEDLNAAFLAEGACHMNDLMQVYAPFDGAAYRGERVKQAMSVLSEYMSSGYFRADGEQVRFSDVEAALEAIDGMETAPMQRVRYGVCVTLANLRTVPSDLLITDAAGDNDFDIIQDSYVRVNEPVVVRAQTADGEWYYCETISVSGWVRAEHIALCRNRREWLSAWRIAPEDLMVITEGRLYLDYANVNAASSHRLLTMGTTLRRVKDSDYAPDVTNRAPYHNTAVWLPVRDEQGMYGATIALIPQHCAVSAGYLPLTTENLLNVAFSMLGDAYGWGGMLAEPDCSLYMRNIYKCFGLELPRNTTWQSAMPALSTALADMTPEAKAAALDDMPAGTLLFFRGHEMMYLGEANGLHYVISSTSSMMTPDGETKQRVRGVIINTLEGTMRANGHTWMEDLNMAVQPWLPQPDEAAEEAPANAA